jgi:SAM-dependent methyltransferase
MNWPHYRAAAELKRIKGARVLVVGANTGEDCRPFVEMGAAEVHGLDPIENVGANFKHDRLTYHRAMIEAAELPAGYFDLVFSVATLEHVADIESAFASMGRLCAPGGAIYCCAAPLWNSPYGHHMTCFDGHPWAHVIYGRDGLLNFSKQNGITGERGHSIDAIISYIFDSDAFNRKPANDYVIAASYVSREFSVFQNRLDFSALTPPPSLPQTEARAVSHYLRAIKRGSYYSVGRFYGTRSIGRAENIFKQRAKSTAL